MTKYGFLCMIDRSGYSNNINFISFVMFWIRSTPCLKGGMTFAYNLQILFISEYVLAYSDISMMVIPREKTFLYQTIYAEY